MSSGRRVEVITIQEAGGTKKTIRRGSRKEMLAELQALHREPVPLSELILGTECGGSDYTRIWPQTPP